MTDLIDTTEMYLRTIFELEEEGIVPLRARIAERLGHSGPTVSQTVGRMERAGLVVVTDDRHLELTDDGRGKAMRVMRKHRLAERLLVDVIGLEWEFVHEEACRWEHVMSERVERKILSMLDNPTESPYGNPIPGLAELGETGPDEEFLLGLHQLTRWATSTPSDVVVRRIGEPAQADPELLSQLHAAGLRPGKRLRVQATAKGVLVGTAPDGPETELTSAVTDHVFVAEAPRSETRDAAAVTVEGDLEVERI
ncbi:MAG TPA: metal-dependent transcriptional regulator [Actinomycetales bacterium]|nr:metal-dependent transcriptional regulator [Actinomycetales bacterium]